MPAPPALSLDSGSGVRYNIGKRRICGGDFETTWRDVPRGCRGPLDACKES